MRELILVTIYTAFIIMIMALIFVFKGVTSSNACEFRIDDNANVVFCGSSDQLFVAKM